MNIMIVCLLVRLCVCVLVGCLTLVDCNICIARSQEEQERARVGGKEGPLDRKMVVECT